MLWITDTFDLVSDYIYILLDYSNNITLLLTKNLKQRETCYYKKIIIKYLLKGGTLIWKYN